MKEKIHLNLTKIKFCTKLRLIIQWNILGADIDSSDKGESEMCSPMSKQQESP